MTSARISVYSITAFWRYAVGPESAYIPAIPFFFKKNAENMFYEFVHQFPNMGHVLYRRTWGNKIEAILVHKSQPNSLVKPIDSASAEIDQSPLDLPNSP